jgi:hypothetical protein
MILYVTRETFSRFKLKMPDEMVDPAVRTFSHSTIMRETGDGLLEWAGKLFYFDCRKCILVVNFASKLSFVLCDIKLDDLPNVGDLIAGYTMELYANDPEMQKLLLRFYKENPAMVFSRLTDRNMIATLNNKLLNALDDGYRLYDYIQDGILHTRKINTDLNRNLLSAEKIDGKKDYFFSAEKFEELLKARYANK